MIKDILNYKDTILIKIFLRQKSGFTLVETLIYLAIFILLSAGILDVFFAIQKTNRNVTILNNLNINAVSVLEKITKETREATSVDLANSIFGANSGVLQINTLDDSNVPHIIKFYKDNNLVKMDLDGQYFGPLMTDSATSTALIFTLATSTAGTLIKTELDLISGQEIYQKSDKFYEAVMLRLNN
jgi:type II secretory pathway pseudopilin PulG